MSMGNKIFELRTAMHLSQADLAALLNVSRQSVSKWETDASVPDLDKLWKLCDVFGVTLDELTYREVNGEIKSAPVVAVVEKEHPMTHQKIIGYILLAVSLIAGILIWIFAESEEELYIPIPIIMSVLTCSLICLFVKQRAGYWCVWSIVAPIILLSPYIAGFPILGALIARIVFVIIMVRVARKLFAEAKVSTSRKKSVVAILGWIALIGLRISYVFILLSVTYPAIGWLPYIVMDLLMYIGTALLLTYTVCYIKSLKRSR